MKSLWNELTGQSKTKTQNQSANQQANIQQQIAPQYNMDRFQQDFCEEQEYPDVSHTHKERMTEDVVESQTQANPLQKKNTKSDKYNALNLSDLMSLSLELAKSKIKLSATEQHHAVKVSISETKLDEIEKQLAEDDTGNDATLDVFAVIDRSGSMYGPRLKNVKQSLKYLLDLLKPTDRISIIIFDDKAETLLAPKLVGKSRALIEQAIDSIQDRGSTDIRSGLRRAFEEMLKRKSKNQVTGVLLLSDGQDNQFFRKGGAIVDTFFEEWSAKLKDHEHTVHTFGYGDDHDETLLDQIAKCKGGNFYYVKDLELVSENFIDCLGGLSSVIGQNATIRINLKAQDVFPEIRFKKTFGGMWSGEKETERTISFGNISKGVAKDFIFEITLPASKDTDALESGSQICKLIDATFSAENLEKTNFEKIETLSVEIHNESEDIEIVENTEVKKHFLRVRGSEAITEAQIRSDDNDYKAGEDLLCCMEDELAQYGDDKVLTNLRSNISKQKKAIIQTSNGENCGMNMKAFSKNMCNTYAMQESAPNYCGDLYENTTKLKMQTRLTKRKGG
jgi:Mg-chelatase subunit ChlD